MCLVSLCWKRDILFHPVFFLFLVLFCVLQVVDLLIRLTSEKKGKPIVCFQDSMDFVLPEMVVVVTRSGRFGDLGRRCLNWCRLLINFSLHLSTFCRNVGAHFRCTRRTVFRHNRFLAAWNRCGNEKVVHGRLAYFSLSFAAEFDTSFMRVQVELPRHFPFCISWIINCSCELCWEQKVVFPTGFASEKFGSQLKEKSKPYGSLFGLLVNLWVAGRCSHLACERKTRHARFCESVQLVRSTCVILFGTLAVWYVTSFLHWTLPAIPAMFDFRLELLASMERCCWNWTQDRQIIV